LAKRVRHVIVDGVLGVHDTPHRIALGVAIALFIAWTPTIGFQMGLTLFFATLLRANKVVGVPFAWLTNPATLWLYIPNYLLGCWLLGEPADITRLVAALGKMFALSGSVSERLAGLGDVLEGFLAPLWLGSVIVGLLLGALGYLAVFRGVLAYRRRHPAPAQGDSSVLP
ncbi:MAG TPA: hypothetical protein DFS52_21850, partial [Myxococcales bacterium]|nr:hypothetical protein [Myxococcales bacterium]